MSINCKERALNDIPLKLGVLEHEEQIIKLKLKTKISLHQRMGAERRLNNIPIYRQRIFKYKESLTKEIDSLKRELKESKLKERRLKR